jgi:Sulfotransferase family
MLMIKNIRVFNEPGQRSSWVDFPQPGFASDGHSFWLKGWSVGPEGEPEAIEVVHDATLLQATSPVARPDVAEHSEHGRWPGAGRSGFMVGIGLLGMPYDFNLLVRARFRDGSTRAAAQIQGSRTPVGQGYSPKYRPIMVTCLGRSGTTLLMELFKCHPEVLVHAPYPYETRCATYWMHMAKLLSEPAPPLHPVEWIPYFANGEHVRPNPFYSDLYLANAAMMEWMDKSYALRTVAFCQSSLDEFYDAAAISEDRKHAIAFAEKQYPGLIADVVEELVPGTREIFCVRDPRDVLVSVSKMIKRPGVSILGHIGDIKIDNLAYRLQVDWMRLVEDYGRRGAGAHLVRYEDLVSRPQETLQKIFGHAGLRSTSELVENCVRTGFGDTITSRGHRTINLEQSVGRWRRELDGPTQELANGLFADAIKIFGYSDTTGV